MSERGCRQGGIPFSVMRRTKKGAGLFFRTYGKVPFFMTVRCQLF